MTGVRGKADGHLGPWGGLRRTAPKSCLPPSPQVAFTVIELLVSVGVLVVAIFALATVFDISSETTGRTVAHAELLEASAAVRQRITDQLSKIQPGLLIIESPAPTQARQEIQGGERLFRLRHDRIVFLARGGPGEFQSCTDPTCGTPALPDREPAASREALVYFGPGIPLSNTPALLERRFDSAAVQLPAAEWAMAHRAILLLLDDPNHPGWTPPDMSVLTGGLLAGGRLNDPVTSNIYQGRMDAVRSSATHLAQGRTLIQIIAEMNPATQLLTATPAIAGLLDPNLVPTTVSLDPGMPLDYYMHGGFTLQPRLADFRVEWTDGQTNNGVPDYGTRWFGLRPYWDSPLNNVDAVQQKAQRRQDAPYAADAFPAELDAFREKIEWSNPSGGTAAADAAYRAIWRADTWDYRPKALRFTYRIYDAGNRLKQPMYLDLDEDGVLDRDEAASWPDLVTRFGQEFSFVVPVP